LLSEEFDGRYRELCPVGGVVPVDIQLCELANPAKWDNPDWMAVLEELQLPAEAKLAMHRKAYEFTQAIWGLRRLDALTAEASVLSVGAGHESLVYWLANRVGHVIATDLYGGEWRSALAAEGDVRVITHPEEFAPFPYRRERLRFLQMDGRYLAFRAGLFDIAYSLSSIEHFGGWQGSRHAVEEMVRVVKPGGLIVLATEWQVSGEPRDEVFQPDEFRALIDLPDCELVEPLDDRVWSRYPQRPVDLEKNPYETPHMLVRLGETVFTSVVVFLRKRG
jgi:SAM-dependent methyltransferase